MLPVFRIQAAVPTNKTFENRIKTLQRMKEGKKKEERERALKGREQARSS